MGSVRLRGVRKAFGDVEVIRGVDIDVEDGEFVVFVGPSGCGKSTLLRMIAGLEDITSGTLEIDGRRVNDRPPKERGIAMVFQTYAIFPHMSVRENVAFGLTIAGASRAEKGRKVAEAARILQMEHLLDRRPSELSGGQRQRVAIGRAIVRDPSVFLFDEPLSNLDAALRMDMRMEIGKLHQSLGASMIYVTHDQVEAMTLADKIVVLKDGEVMQVGAPMELYHDPNNRFVAGFIGSPAMNFLEGTIRGGVAEVPALGGSVDMGLTATGDGTAVLVGMRPEHISVDPAGDQFEVELVESLGGVSYAYLKAATGEKLVVEERDAHRSEMGQRVGLSYDAKDVMVFDKKTENRIRA